MAGNGGGCECERALNGIEFAVLKAKEPEFIKKIVETGEEEE